MILAAPVPRVTGATKDLWGHRGFREHPALEDRGEIQDP